MMLEWQVEMHSWFDILQMKGTNKEFTTKEKDHILNRAQIKYVNEILQTKFLPSVKADEKDKIVYSPTESTISGEESIAPLIMTDLDVTANSLGVLSFANIENIANDWLSQYLDYYPLSYPTGTATYVEEEGAKILMILGIDMWYSSGVDLHPRAPVRYMVFYSWILFYFL